MKTALKIAIIALTAFIITSCGNYEKLLKGHDFDAQYTAAVKYYEQKNYTKALDYYVPLVAVATSDPLRLEARMGIVRCWNAVGDSAHLRVSVQQLLDEPKATTEMRDESNVMLARSYYYADALSQAFEAYSPLLGSANGDYMGEAAFRRAEIRYRP